jgi:outer membrane protein OmpA-like peptidoglycan-associated protein
MRLAGRARFGLVAGGAALLMAASGPVSADGVHERILEVSPVFGVLQLDDNAQYSSATPLTGLRLTLNNSAWWAFEGTVAVSPGQTQSYREGMLESYRFQYVFDAENRIVGAVITDLETRGISNEVDTDLLMVGGSFLLHVTKQRLRPFISIGGGFLDDLSNADEEPPGPFSDAFLDFGVGLKYFRPSGFTFRLDVRDLVARKSDLPRENPRAPLLAAQRDLFTGGGDDGVFLQEPYSPVDYRGRRWLNNIAVTASVSFPFGWVWKDADGDEIANRFDDCPTTAPGVVVDGVGCGIDSDQDGVFDGLDQCDVTPIGATVDLVGCPSDSDQDGVFDGLDLMNDTPIGALVDAQGRHFDTDEDGVLDGLDLCENTPLGAGVDNDGCAENPLEKQLLQGDKIIVQEAEFEPGSEEIEPLSFHAINKVAVLLERWTGNEERPLKIEIGVHTDGIGAAGFNQELSERRATKLRQYLLETFYDMGANNLVATGYGESMPISSDTTEEGRAANRRIEVLVLSPGDPPEEYDFGADEEEEDLGGFFDEEFDEEFDADFDAEFGADFDEEFGEEPGASASDATEDAGADKVGEIELPPDAIMPDLDEDIELELPEEPEPPKVELE